MKTLFSYEKGGVMYFTANKWTALLRDERRIPVDYKIVLPKTIKRNARK
jgi:hypothetical protein